MAEQNTDTLARDAETSSEEIQDLPEESIVSTPTPEYDLRISSDKVSVILDCPDPLADVDSLVTRILADFAKLEIPIFPDEDQLRDILGNIAEPGRHLLDAPIIMGQKVTPSRDGKLVWSKEYFAEGWAVDEATGVIDFWEKLEQRSVREEEMMVKLFHPVDGQPGLNVFGNEIPVTKPAKVKLRCGKGVRTEEVEDGILYFATVNGRVRFADGTISVDDVYQIKGNVSLATGNIRHTGAVQIQGDVETGATIEAEGDIMIKGMVDPCNIRCGGTLTVAGGLVGAEGFRIEVAGDLNARYVNEADITVEGDVTVSNEISHSRIRSLGRVVVQRGRIAGGIVQAYKGIRVAEAGASGSSDTTLIAGIDYSLAQKTTVHEVKIKKMEEAQEKILAAVEKTAANKAALGPEERKVLAGLQVKAKQMGQALADEYAMIRKLNEEVRNHAVYEVIIFQELWSGTRIQLGEFKTIVRTSIKKPRIAQLRKTKVRILPLGEGNMPKN